jgi:tetratricopeptide (TPR) repeat protein
MSKIELWIVAPLLGFACWLGTGTDASPQNSKASEASQRCLIDLKNLNFQAGIDDCTRAIALNPKDEQSLELRCEAHANLGDFPAALPDCTQALALNPKDELSLLLRCAIYAQLGNFAAALPDCSQAITLNPRNSMGYINRASVEFSLKNYDSAIADLSAAARYIEIDVARMDCWKTIRRPSATALKRSV